MNQLFVSHVVNFEENVQNRFKEMYVFIAGILNNSEECISYGIPTFKINGKNCFHFAAYKKHIGVYPGAKGIELFSEKFSNFPQSKGTFQLPHSKEIPWEILKELVVWCKINCEKRSE